MRIASQIKSRRPLLDPAQRQMLDRVIADRAKTQGIAHGAMDKGQGESLDQTQDLLIFPLASGAPVLLAQPGFQ